MQKSATPEVALKPLQGALTKLLGLEAGLNEAFQVDVPAAELRKKAAEFHKNFQGSLREVNRAYKCLAIYVTGVQRTSKMLEDSLATQMRKSSTLEVECKQAKEQSALHLLVAALRQVVHLRRQIKNKGENHYPTGKKTTLVATTIFDIQTLRQASPRLANEAIRTILAPMRRLITVYNGYEADLDTEGSMLIAFHSTRDAIVWCCETQKVLLSAPWTPDMLALRACRKEVDQNGHVLFCGLRVQMGITTGEPTIRHDVVTEEADYTGSMVAEAKSIAATARLGEVVVANPAFEHLQEEIDGPTKKAPLRGIMVLPRGAYILTNGSPVLLRTMLPTDLGGRRQFYGSETVAKQPRVVATVEQDTWNIAAPGTPLPADVAPSAPLGEVKELTSAAEGSKVDNIDPVLLECTRRVVTATGADVEVKKAGVITSLSKAAAAAHKMQMHITSLETMVGEAKEAQPPPMERAYTMDPAPRSNSPGLLGSPAPSYSGGTSLPSLVDTSLCPMVPTRSSTPPPSAEPMAAAPSAAPKPMLKKKLSGLKTRSRENSPEPSFPRQNTVDPLSSPAAPLPPPMPHRQESYDSAISSTSGGPGAVPFRRRTPSLGRREEDDLPPISSPSTPDQGGCRPQSPKTPQTDDKQEDTEDSLDGWGWKSVKQELSDLRCVGPALPRRVSKRDESPPPAVVGEPFGLLSVIGSVVGGTAARGRPMPRSAPASRNNSNSPSPDHRRPTIKFSNLQPPSQCSALKVNGASAGAAAPGPNASPNRQRVSPPRSRTPPGRALPSFTNGISAISGPQPWPDTAVSAAVKKCPVRRI
eukprot:NODE_316_length_2691_cov_72.177960_g298_i0.p1 GENE.NODE_316_length_2691_cov_72.177960_g298_i0~~NODE_316_length_2691_cov_72.177960_g298_i0.p1  ORF type:complete len:814 (+),score=122.79 NODE_316_length_2691_cov_72.177960_g298_i0:131-2572(+)